MHISKGVFAHIYAGQSVEYQGYRSEQAIVSVPQEQYSEDPSGEQRKGKVVQSTLGSGIDQALSIAFGLVGGEQISGNDGGDKYA